MRPIRYYDPSLLHEITARTIGGAFLFDPERNPEIGPAFDAILARAQNRHKVRIFSYFVMSNHYHALVSAPDHDAMAAFLNEVHASMARYANRIHSRIGPVFSGPCKAVPVLPTEDTLVRRVAYLMGQAIKAVPGVGLLGWAGANSNRALLEGHSAVGRHFDYHRQTLDARRKGGPREEAAYVSHPVVELSVLPCWAHLSPEAQRENYRTAGKMAEAEYAIRQQGPDLTSVQEPESKKESGAPSSAGRNNMAMLGDTDDAAQAAPVRTKPELPPRRRPPRLIVHAACQNERDAFEKAFAEVCAAYRVAADDLAVQTARAHSCESSAAVVFPAHTFPCAVKTGRMVRVGGWRNATAQAPQATTGRLSEPAG